MNNSEYFKWLEERSAKLIEIENMINQLQHDVNDNQKITNIDDIKMEIFKLWYFDNVGDKYGK